MERFVIGIVDVLVAFTKSAFALVINPQGRAAAVVLVGLALAVLLLRYVPLTRKICDGVQDCEAGLPEYRDDEGGRRQHAEGIFPRKGPLFIGTPARIDTTMRIIRRTCPLRIARAPGKCGLCGQDIYEDDSIRILPCAHSYHNLCILRWFVLSHMRCPDCNLKIET